MRPPPHPLRVVLLPTVLLCALAGLACPSREERFAAHVARGEELAAAGQREEAILEYRSALNLDASSAEINQRIAALLSRQGEIEAATRFFLEAYRLDPDRIDAAMRYAQLIAWTNRRRANELVAEALEKAPERSIVHRTVAALALIDGDVEAALEAAQRGVELDARDPESWIQLGRVHQGRLVAARQAKTPVPDSVFRDAIAAFERADELRGGDVGVRIERARVFGAWPNHAAETRRAFVEAFELASERGDDEEQVVAGSALAEYANAVGERELRIRGLRAIVAIRPDSIASWRELAALEGEAVYSELLAVRPDDARAHRLWINHLLAQDRSREALEHLERVLAGGLESPMLWDDLIRHRLQRGQMRQALDALGALEDQAPDHPATRRARARVDIAQRRNGRAVERLRSIPAESQTSDGRRLLALAEYRRGNLAEAKEAIARSLTLARSVSYPALRLKARIHHDAQEWRPALQAFTQLLTDDIELTPHEQLMAARTLYERGRRSAGRRMLVALLSASDPPASAAVEYARREGRRDPVGAMRQLKLAYERSPSFTTLRAMTLIDRSARKRDPGMRRALERVDAAVEKGEGGPAALLLRAEILADMGELDRAETDALRAFEAAPALPGAVDLLTDIYRRQKKLAEALGSFEEAEQAGVLHAGARRLLARLYAEQGRRTDAVAMLEKVIEDNPRTIGAKRDLARLLAVEGGDIERALELAREASERQREDARSAATLAQVYFQRGYHEAALREYRRAIDLDRISGERNAASLWYGLGLTLQMLDRNEPARRAFESALAISPDFPEAADARKRLRNTSSG